MNKRHKGFGSARHQRGVAAVIVALWMTVLLGIGAFSIDIARAFVTRNELQNAADAAALASAGRLFPVIAATGQPDWATAATQATSAIAWNRSEGSLLAQATVQTGYWNVDTSVGNWNNAIALSVGAVGSSLPAVEVTVQRDGANNGGPIAMTFGNLFGVATMPVSARAVAVVAKAITLPTGTILPFAMSSCVLTDPGLINQTTNVPVSPPPKFVLGSAAASAKCGTCNCGQWTTFASTDNSASYVNSLINGGNPTSVSVGGNTYIQPGTKASNYGEVNSVLVGKIVLVPMVADSAINSTGYTPIQGYACIEIIAGIQGGPPATVCSQHPIGTPIPGGGVIDNKCIIARFVIPDPTKPRQCEPPGATAGTAGSFLVNVPPRLSSYASSN